MKILLWTLNDIFSARLVLLPLIFLYIEFDGK